jgi:LysM repeat protein
VIINYFYEFCSPNKDIMRHHFLKIILFSSFLLIITNLNAQYRMYYDSYFNQYRDLAIEQMDRYKIPASITLAQGVFESGAGRSELARNSNNHFGIKCGSNWKGDKTYHTDDAPNECFRAYKSVRDSYEDHSLFLSRGQRYHFLFDLDKTDYRGWAIGLKKAGYATDPSYANRLISIIEEYQLYKYDNTTIKENKEHHNKHHHKEILSNPIVAHDVHIANDVVYTIARQGDTFDLLSEEFNISTRKLVKYNDLQKDYTLQPGDIIYLHKKQRKAAKNCITHIVEAGESMHSISQRYGMRLKSLYKLNEKSGDYIPMVGDTLWLR